MDSFRSFTDGFGAGRNTGSVKPTGLGGDGATPPPAETMQTDSAALPKPMEHA